MNKKIIIFSIIVLLSLSFASISHADDPFTTTGGPTFNSGSVSGGPTFNSNSNCASGTICNPLSGSSNLYDFIANVLTEVAKIGAVVCVFFIIYAGFLYVTAQGNEEKLKTAHKALIYTLIGVVILLGAELIAKVITTTINKL